MSEYERILKDEKYFYCLVNAITITLDAIIELEKNKAAKTTEVKFKLKKEED